MIHNCEPGLIAHCTYSTQAYGLRFYPQNMLRNWSDKAAAATHEAPQNMTPRRDDMQKTAKDNPNGDASNAPLAVPIWLQVPVPVPVPGPVPVPVPVRRRRTNIGGGSMRRMRHSVSLLLKQVPLHSAVAIADEHVDVTVPQQSAVA